jgi:aspartate aminotransferase
MSFLSSRAHSIKPSATFAVAKKAKDRKNEGLEVFDLSVGEPDFAMPSYIHEGIHKALHDEKTKYTNIDGIAELKTQICHKFEKENNLHFSPENIIVSTGGKQVLFNAFLATLDEEDEVIVPQPYWVSYPEMIRFAQGTVVNCPSTSEFKITPESLKKSITSKTKWLILNSPSNPTGTVYSKHDLEELSKVLLEHPHVWIMTDDIYEHLIYDDLKFYNILNVCPQLQSRTLIVNGFSKAFAMTGLRLGYGAGPSELIKAMTTIQSQSTSNASSLIQYAGLCALQGDMSFLKSWRAEYQKRRDLCLETLKQSPHLSIQKPQGAFYILPQLIGRTDDTEFAVNLLQETGVVVVPGSAFGAPGHFRISFSVTKETLQEACSRIVHFLSKEG